MGSLFTTLAFHPNHATNAKTNLRKCSGRNALYVCYMKRLRNSLTILFTLFAVHSSYCQSDNSKQTFKGDVDVIADSSVIRLERNGRRLREIKGYRVQLFLGPLEEAKAERNKYLSLGLPYSAYMKQIVPEHALQVGDFKTRLELDKCLSELEEYYPKAFAIVDVIETSGTSGASKTSR